MMYSHKAMYPRTDVNRLYVRRDNGGRGLTSILDTVQYEEPSTVVPNLCL